MLKRIHHAAVIGAKFEVEDVEVCKTKLESFGISVEEIRLDEYTGQRFVFFTDPDGLPLELYKSL